MNTIGFEMGALLGLVAGCLGMILLTGLSRAAAEDETNTVGGTLEERPQMLQ